VPKYKYEPLKEFLDLTPRHISCVTFSFSQIELIIRDKLPPGAYKYREGWSNHSGFARARGWLPDWRSGPVNVEEQWVTFTRIQEQSNTQVDRKESTMSKYDPLRTFLERASATVTEMTLSFDQIEGILGFTLPASARKHRPWWENPTSTSRHSQAQAWLAAGWKVDAVDQRDEWVRFGRGTL